MSAFSIDYRSELNDDQFAAVTSEIGPALVLAGAGSGKTRTLTYRVAWLVEQGLAPYEILLLTFTNKAAREMLERVEHLTGIHSSKFLGGTFHHVAQRILRSHAETVGLQPSFNIIDTSDADSLLSDVVKAEEPTFLKSKDNPKARVIYEIISFSRNTQRSIAEVIKDKYPHFEMLIDSIQHFFNVFQTRKKEQNLVDYDDLLCYLLELLQKDTEAAQKYQQRFRYVLVDEYQDTNYLQSAIIDILAAHHNVMAVGDDAQCIYTWRGADFENIMTFGERHPGTQLFKIEVNYRSTPEILDFANRILESQPPGRGYEKILRPVRGSKEKPWFVPAMDTRHQAQFIVRRVQALIEAGTRAQDIAVLYRAHFHAMDLQMELSRFSIPYQITSGVRFFEQAHVKDLVAHLRLVSNPNDTLSFNRLACLLPKIGPKSAQRLHELTKKTADLQQTNFFMAMAMDAVVAKVNENAKEDWLDLAYTLQDLASGWTKEKPHDLIEIAISGWYGDFLKKIFTNWRNRQEDLTSLRGFAARFQDMSELLAQLILLNSETTDRSAEATEESVKLTTVHQAKGLEFPVVFIIGLAQGMFPSKRSLEDGDLEEERRLFYVAATRAQDELYLTYPRVANVGGPPSLVEPSRFLREVGEDLYEKISLPSMR